ncbi:MAG: PilC/PilY family type IV pilus protein [Burkholderiaceae bacterium]|nr:PilC/PilY family type IV pilus protein [Burkholderiaceae bacterium]
MRHAEALGRCLLALGLGGLIAPLPLAAAPLSLAQQPLCHSASAATPTHLASHPSTVIESMALVFQTAYQASTWTGEITAQIAAQGTAQREPNPAWGTRADGTPRSTANTLDALGNETVQTQRVVYTYHQGGRLFLWDQLSTGPGGQQTLLQGDGGAALGQDRLHFLRGDRRLEKAQGGPLRDRPSRQGDSVNSALWFTGRPSGGWGLPGYGAFAAQHKERRPMLYVGANDGMLHGFSAEDGSEHLAYVPLGVYPHLAQLTQPGDAPAHRYLVDGSPFTGDANVGTPTQPQWRTLLVGPLGAGGKGYFVLDVTEPGRQGSAAGAWSATSAAAASVVRLDLSDGSDPDIGHIVGDPVRAEFSPQQATQIARLNDGRWAVLLGNGINSTHEDPVLLVQYLDQGSPSLRKIAAATGSGSHGTGNGLATPRPVDLNGDGTPDVVYAGDFQGHLWKFDLSSHLPGEWGVAFSSPGCTPCTPLFSATDASGTPQAITAAPSVRNHTRTGGLMVAFGTGRLLTAADATSTAAQSFYAVHDGTRYALDPRPGAPPGSLRVAEPDGAARHGSRGALLERRLGTARTGADGSALWQMPAGQERLPTLGAQGPQGWFFDFPQAGERMLQTAGFVDGSHVLHIHSQVPAQPGRPDAPCGTGASAAQGFLTLLGIEQGLAPSLPLLHSEGAGLRPGRAGQDPGAHRTSSHPVLLNLRCPQGICQMEPQASGPARHIGTLPKPATTLHWRQLQ